MNVPQCELIPEGENWPCHVGGGLCHEPAVMRIPMGQDLYVCQTHMPEFLAALKEVSTWSHEQVLEFNRMANEL